MSGKLGTLLFLTMFKSREVGNGAFHLFICQWHHILFTSSCACYNFWENTFHALFIASAATPSFHKEIIKLIKSVPHRNFPETYFTVI